jgi:8-oxo-dGTP diphosphatase
MRTRPSARLLVLNPDGKVLLFRFVFRSGGWAGRQFWATPGGGLEEGETFKDAARRELREETGIDVADPGPSVAYQEFVLPMPAGEDVLAQEHFFVVRADGTGLSRDGWTALEIDVMSEHRWWSLRDLEETGETVFPKDIVGILTRVGVQDVNAA